MQSIDIFSTQRIRFRGRYCFEDAYKAVYKTFNKRRYDVFEKRYEKNGDDRVTVEIEGQREITALIRRRVQVRLRSFNTQEFPVDVGGETKMMCNGRFVASITGYIDIDYRGIFSDVGPLGDLSPHLLSFMRNGPFKKYFGNRYFGPFYKDGVRMQNAVNEALGRET